MPDGVVQWIDPKTGEGRILHAGRRYAVQASDMEADARTPGARVHFDIKRREGAVDAVHVRLRGGTRVSRRQRRFGDLTGAHSPDEKGTAPFADAQPSLGHELSRHPLAVARRWAQLMAAGDAEEAMLLYAPNAALHAEGQVLVGTSAVRGYWGTSAIVGMAPPVSIEGEDGTVLLRWAAVTGEESAPESHLRIVHGEIAEQWLGQFWVTEQIALGEERARKTVVTASGDIADADRATAIDKIGRLLEAIDEPVLFSSVRLGMAADPARERPALARATLDIDGSPLRAHVAGKTMAEAIDLLEARLRDRLEHVARHRRALRRRGPTSPPGEWRHGDLPTQRESFYPRPADEREVVRHKSYAPEELTVDEAAFDLESLDYDFYLFTDLATGQDCLIDHHRGGVYGLRYADGAPEEPSGPAAAELEVDQQPAPVLSQQAAVERLDAGAEPWVFFRDQESGRGHVMYRRYDGHYGLIAPVDEAVPA